MATQTLARLTPAQVDAFWRDGYLALPDFLSDDDIATLRTSMDALESWAQSHEHRDFQREPNALHIERLAIRKINHIHKYGGVIWDELMRRDEVLDLMEDLIGPDIRFHHSKMMVKAAVRRLSQALAPGPAGRLHHARGSRPSAPVGNRLAARAGAGRRHPVLPGRFDA